jgi:hypothetical protein
MALTKTPAERKAALDAALAEHMPAEIIQAEIVAEESKLYKPTDKELVSDSEEDYKFTRESVKQLINTSNEAIAVMFELASNCENPRAFEVLANMLKSTADMNNQLLIIQKERKKILQADAKKGELVVPVTNNTTNNIVFAGPTSELQKFLAARETAPVVDV